jgi:hypothetical protein
MFPPILRVITYMDVSTGAGHETAGTEHETVSERSAIA